MSRRWSLALAAACAILVGGCYDSHLRPARPVILIVGDAGTSDAGPVPGCFPEANSLILLEPGCATFHVETGSEEHACIPRWPSEPPGTGIPVRLVLGGSAGTLGDATVTFHSPAGSRGFVLIVPEDMCSACTVGGVDRTWTMVVDGQAELLVARPASIELCSRR